MGPQNYSFKSPVFWNFLFLRDFWGSNFLVFCLCFFLSKFCRVGFWSFNVFDFVSKQKFINFLFFAFCFSSVLLFFHVSCFKKCSIFDASQLIGSVFSFPFLLIWMERFFFLDLHRSRKLPFLKSFKVGCFPVCKL